MRPANQVEVAVYQKAKKGNYCCGDSYIYTKTQEEFICAIADGLGSGEYALESSRITIDIIKQNVDATVEELVEKCNKELIGKRGVVLGILKLHFPSNTYSFSSIGNIGVITIIDGKKKERNIPSGGYLAGYKRPFKVVRGKLLPKMNFILFSDGVSDEELSKKLFLDRNVNNIIDTFKQQSRTERKDDTTLIAVSYDQ
ncbi:MAG TPA: SpoIIE family protein phosphatase [Candidatus Avamphibacillus sp.]|nr:SpoIIE family protein phosphatase [Candidatus Avamphibacillus sp.]